ncbi:hypothetical protein O9Z70_00440 [Devosia sp. YIM 151766]|uniref:hypothetical protein n=1 Tax=Devosia sp. YIM 151766 TaxID=3017325 RepID=UPI00255C7323|nr:hypothetical protein [Devosia sp. YIM 151766]WIY53049.1 hypothetical protein O9Z70_00440 [Devosia sp. YIM 151766]
MRLIENNKPVDYILPDPPIAERILAMAYIDRLAATVQHAQFSNALTAVLSIAHDVPGRIAAESSVKRRIGTLLRAMEPPEEFSPLR